MAKVRVCRVIILEGDSDWAKSVLDDSFLEVNTPYNAGRGTITEVARLREIIPDPLEPVHNPIDSLRPEVPRGK